MSEKTKGLFDHLNAVYTDQRVAYWDELSEASRKSYSPFMINRFLSMNMDYLEVVNLFQTYYNAITSRESYLFYADALPKGKRWAKYVKGKKEKDYEDWLLNIVTTHFKVSQSEAMEYIDLHLQTDEGKEALRNLLQKYGADPKKIKKVVK